MSPRLHLRALWVALLAAGLLYCSPAHASGPAPLSLTQLTRKAGFIFAGRVLHVERPIPVDGSVPVVRVILQVERALRNTRRGEFFTLTQWAGAWDNGSQFRPGQRLLLFLYPRSGTGLTSVVGGRLGQFDLDPGGNIVLRADQERILLAPEEGSSVPPASHARALTKFPYHDFAGRVRQALQQNEP